MNYICFNKRHIFRPHELLWYTLLLISLHREKRKGKKKKEQFSPLSVSTPILDREYKPETNKRDNRPPSRKPFARVSITILVHRAYQRSSNLLPPSFPDYSTSNPLHPTRYTFSSPSIVSTRIGHKRRALKPDSSLNGRRFRLVKY